MKIKQKPEDFIVKEKFNLQFSQGRYAYFLMKKKQWNTMDAVKEIANRTGMPEKIISYAGIKDRQAVTEQHIAILNGDREIENLKIKDITLKYLGNGSERIHTGNLEGNEFEIVAQELEKGAVARKMMPNYFDEQRFGMNNTNAEVGKAIVMKDFKRACELLKLEPNGKEYAMALKKEGKMLSMYLHSYQSRLFNLILSEYIKSKFRHKEINCGYDMLAFPLEDPEENTKIPLISFDMEAEGEIKEIIDKLLRKEGITKRDFIIRSLPELVSQTEYRNAFAEIKGLDIGKLEGGSQTLKFLLDKGSYATVAIKALFLQNI